MAQAKSLATKVDMISESDREGKWSIWDTIDYEAADSDDELVLSSSPARSENGSADDDTTDGAMNEFLLQQMRDILRAIREGANKQMPETALILKAIHMLHGLPTSLFEITPVHRVTAVEGATLAEVSATATKSILDKFADLGSRLLPLRAWTLVEEQSPTLRRFQAVVESLLAKSLAEFQVAECQMLDSRSESPTCINILANAESKTRTICLLGSCLPEVKGHDRDARLLESIVQCIIEQEALGTPTDELERAFIECFEAYWQPIEAWLQGENVPCDGISFIDSAVEKDIPLDAIWTGLFEFTLLETGLFDAPGFLQSFVPQLMTIGKTTYMLNKLERGDSIHELTIPRNWLASALLHDRQSLEPFTNSLATAIQQRLNMSTSLSKALLRNLHVDWGFGETLNVIELVYLARVGSINDRAHTDLFRLVDRSQRKEWQDQYVLTDIFQEAFKGVDHIDPAHLAVSLVPSERSDSSRDRSLVQFEAIHIHFALPWPVANIVDDGALSVLQRVAVLLLQVARAKDVLDQCVIYFESSQVAAVGTRRQVTRLQQRLRWFVNTLHSYLAFDILAAASTDISTSVQHAANLDTVIRELNSAMKSLERGCFLSEGLTLSHQAIVSILDLAVVLSDMCLQNRFSARKTSTQGPEDVLDEEDFDQNVADGPPTQTLKSDIVLDPAKLKGLSDTFLELTKFLRAGVREASRTQGDRRLEMFADDLGLELGHAK